MTVTEDPLRAAPPAGGLRSALEGGPRCCCNAAENQEDRPSGAGASPQRLPPQGSCRWRSGPAGRPSARRWTRESLVALCGRGVTVPSHTLPAEEAELRCTVTLHTHSASALALFRFSLARQCSSENGSDLFPLASVKPRALPVFGATGHSALPTPTRTT